jgi:amino acid transporter
MKKNVLVFGLMAGLIVTAFMIISVGRCYTQEDFEGNVLLGYASMILAFSLIFVGVKNYRDKYNQGVISFQKAFKMGLYITLVASTLYVLVWLVDYYVFIPDFMDKYTAQVLKEAQSKNLSPAELRAKPAEMANYKELYKNPLFVVLFTYLEILPVGILISLLSALLLKRKSDTTIAVA